MQKELFVVQRCWHSGPNQYQPLDYLRLFLSQPEAEEAAYHSAHAWSRYHKPNSEASVKTLLLPSYPAHNTIGTSYGFIAHGSLFWVRSLMATVASDHFEGYALVTEGVIGGTGNRNSRRGTEVPNGRVFLGDDSSNSRFTALQVCHQVIASLPQTCNTCVATMPIGKPKDNYNTGKFLQEWPPQVLQPHLVNNTGSNNNEHKRESHWLDPQQNYSAEEGGTVVECPFETPNPKRRRFCNIQDENSNVWQIPSQNPGGGEEEMLMS
jgi:hypothetical protein